MTRIFGHYVSLEMVLLCLVELLLSFLVIYFMVTSTAVVDGPAHLAAGANLAALLAFTIAATGVAIGLYRPEICLQRKRLLVTATVAGLVAFPAVLIVSQTLSIQLNHYYLTWIVKVLCVWIACLLATRWVFGLAMRSRLFTRPVLVLGSGTRATRVAEVVRSQPGRFFHLAGMVDPSLVEGNGVPDCGRVWGLVVAADSLGAVSVQDLLRHKRNGVRVLDDVRFWEQHLGRIDLDHIGPGWLVFADGFGGSRAEDALRRVGDVLISLLLLFLTLPLMLCVALLIKFESAGPVFYRQERVGLNGRVFTLFKFRSMSVDAEKEGKPLWASQRDPRITRVGAFMRATRIDELPQLLNVLRGEMSFVGPRPERPHFVEQLEQIIPFYRERSWVKPGITGWAQVNYPYGASVEDAREKLAYDLYYVKNRSLFLDLLILTSTVRVILFQEGAR